MPVTPIPPDAGLDEERREILACVLDAMAGNTHDAEEMAVYGRLLRHLTQTAGGKLLPLHAVQQDRQGRCSLGMTAET